MKRSNRKLPVSAHEKIQYLETGQLKIFVRVLPYIYPQQNVSGYLITTIEIKPSGSLTEYWLTIMGDHLDRITNNQILRYIHRLHQRGLYKTCKKIISLIEHKTGTKASLNGNDEITFRRKCKKIKTARYNDY